MIEVDCRATLVSHQLPDEANAYLHLYRPQACLGSYPSLRWATSPPGKNVASERSGLVQMMST